MSKNRQPNLGRSITKSLTIGGTAALYSFVFESMLRGMLPTNVSAFVPVSNAQEVFVTTTMAALTYDIVKDFILRPIAPDLAKSLPEN